MKRTIPLTASSTPEVAHRLLPSATIRPAASWRTLLSLCGRTSVGRGRRILEQSTGRVRGVNPVHGLDTFGVTARTREHFVAIDCKQRPRRLIAFGNDPALGEARIPG